jgi:glycosyltransferase involved in cell wall biosynthesis
VFKEAETCTLVRPVSASREVSNQCLYGTRADPKATLNSPHRIGFISPNYHPRTCGVGDHSMRLGEQLSKMGWEVRVFTRNPAERHPEAPHLEVTGVPGDSPRTVLGAIETLVNEWQPEKLLLQYTAQMFGAGRFGSQQLALILERMRRQEIGCAALVHELFIPWSTRPDLTVGAAMQRIALARLAGRCDCLAVTTASRIELAERWGRIGGLRRPMSVIPVGPNATPVPRVNHGPPRIGTFTTAAVGKRLDAVLDAFGQAARVRPDLELVLLGDLGRAADRGGRALIESVKQHPYASRIRLPGKLPLEEVAKEIARLQVFLFPMDTGANTRSSTLPTALGSAIPVVAVRGIETDERFVDGENVLFARGLDGPSFAEATLRLLEDDALADRIGAGGRWLFEERLAWPRIAEAVVALLS